MSNEVHSIVKLLKRKKHPDQVADIRSQLRNEGAKAQAAFEKKARKQEEDLRRTLADREKADEVHPRTGLLTGRHSYSLELYYRSSIDPKLETMLRD